MSSRGRGRGRYNDSSSSSTNGYNSAAQSVSTYAASYAEPPTFSNVDEATRSWLNQLRFVWSLWKKSAGITQTLHEYFDSSPNAYQSALFVMLNCGDFNQAKVNSLAFTVMEEFCMWISPKKAALRPCLTRSVKFEAFTVVQTQRQPQLVKMVVDAYEMADDKLIFLEPVKKLLAEKQYKEACQSITYLGLHQHFSVDEILVPLIFQDKLNVAMDFLASSPQHQIGIVSFLDDLLGQRSVRNEADAISIRLDIPDVKTEKLYSKPLGKLVARLVKTYHLPQESCPNLNKKRREGALQFLTYKRYVDKSLSLESWREMAAEAVVQDKRLHPELVESCNTYGDVEEALYWAKRLSLPEERWPYNVIALNDNRLEPDGGEQGGENWDEDSTVLYHMFPLSLENVIVVDSPRTFSQMQEALQRVSMVGIDSEWKPHFGTQRSELALIQVATNTQVFILDATHLTSDPEQFERHWLHLATTLFNNDKILKLGFGLSADMTMIRSSVPALSQINQRNSGYMDLINVWKKLVQEHGFKFPHEGSDVHTGESLSRLVECTLGRRLCKTEQFSNWERRPLRDCQKVYAALDAYCLLQVYEQLGACCEAQDIPFQEICQEVVSNAKCKKPTRSKLEPKVVPAGAGGQSDQVESPFTQTSRPRDLRVVCDTMIQGLGKQLRKCGIDAVNLEPGQGHDYLYDVANREQRCILTKGKNFKEFVNYVPRGRCFQVVSDVLDEQVVDVLRYFNVVVTKEDVFTRCQMCNSSCLVKVSNFTMRQLAANASHAPVRQPTASFQRLHQHQPSTFADFESDCESDDEGHAPPVAGQQATPAETKKPASGIDVASCQTHFGAKVQVSTIPDDILALKEMFYVCEWCGKCYWDGSHFGRFVASIDNILSASN